MDSNAGLLNEAADLIEEWLSAHVYSEDDAETQDFENDPAHDLIRRLREAAKPRVLQDYLLQINYRTNSGMASSRRVRVAAASYDEAYTKARDKVRRARGVDRIDGGHAIGQPLPIA